MTDEEKLNHPKTKAVLNFLGKDKFDEEVRRLGIDVVVHCYTTIYDLSDSLTRKFH